MATTKKTFNSWLEFTRLQFPITGALQVGSSSTFTLSRQVEWQTPALLIIEPDEIRADKLSAAVENHANWIVKQAVVSNHVGEEFFYSASNPNESGLLKPETLTPIWQNIRTTEQRHLACTTIDLIIEQYKELSNQFNWLVIDCLSAVIILQGAQQHLKDFDVIIVRSILDNALFENTGTTKTEIDAVLVNNGFSYICCEEELHPAVGKLLYIRDFKKQLVAELTSYHNHLEQLTKANNEAVKLAEELKIQLEAAAKEKTQLIKAHEQQTMVTTEKQSQIEQLTKAKNEAVKQAEEFRIQFEAAAKEKEQFTETSDQQSKTAIEKQEQLEQVTKARDEQTKLATERQTEITKLKVSLQEADNRRNQLESLIAEREQRQQLMNEEMIRAEGQIDLIKDLLLREPGL